MSATLSQRLDTHITKVLDEPLAEQVVAETESFPTPALEDLEVPRAVYLHAPPDEARRLFNGYKNHIDLIKKSEPRVVSHLHPGTERYRKLRTKQRKQLVHDKQVLDIGLQRKLTNVAKDEMAYQNFWVRRRLAETQSTINNKLDPGVLRGRRFCRENRRHTLNRYGRTHNTFNRTGKTIAGYKKRPATSNAPTTSSRKLGHSLSAPKLAKRQARASTSRNHRVIHTPRLQDITLPKGWSDLSKFRSIFSEEELKNLIWMFHHMDRNKNAALSIEEMSNSLVDPKGSLYKARKDAELMFSALDTSSMNAKGCDLHGWIQRWYTAVRRAGSKDVLRSPLKLFSPSSARPSSSK